MTTPTKRLIPAAFAAFALCLGAGADDTHGTVQLWEGGPYWATTNIGAEEPEDYGYYFWWGDTVGYRREGNAWVAVDGSNNNFSFSDSATLTWNKDNATLLAEGYIDSTGNLAAAHDAATAHWGASWRMPTEAEIAALISNCTATWTTRNGVYGRLVRGKDDYADRSIFLPAAGHGAGSGHSHPGAFGGYLSSTPDSNRPTCMWSLGFNSGNYGQEDSYRYYGRSGGQSIRPVYATTDIPPELVEEGLTQDTNGYYMLGSVEDWRKFATLVETTPTANAKMIADIDLVDDQTIIGTSSAPYQGTFDGQGRTLTVNYRANTAGIAPFQYVGAATIKCLHVDGSIINSADASGGIAGNVWGSLTVSQCWVSTYLSARSTYSSYYARGGIGGICCYVYNTENASVLIEDCVFSGSVDNANTDFCGGFMSHAEGSNNHATITNCLNLGTFPAGAYDTATFARNVYTDNRTIGNCYYKNAFGAAQGVHATDEELANGTTVAALQGGREETIWVQNAQTGQPALVVFYETETITWLNDDESQIGQDIVGRGTIPAHAVPTKAADVPYRWVFTGWTPELEAAVSNTTYTATFKQVTDLTLCTNDWTAADGDEIVGVTTHKVTIPGGATVTINGIEVAGAGGGGSVPAPAFAAGGASEIVKFAQAEGGKWTITAFAEMSNESRGTDVTDGQIKVYSADTLEALEGATTPAAGATVKETKSAVKATVEVPAPSGKDSQFFKVQFGE